MIDEAGYCLSKSLDTALGSPVRNWRMFRVGVVIVRFAQFVIGKDQNSRPSWKPKPHVEGDATKASSSW